MNREATLARECSICLRGIGGLLALALLLVLTGTSYASTISFFTTTGATTTGGSVQARADFTINSGSIILTLTNLGQNPISDAQLISNIQFSISGAAGSGNLSTLNSGLITTINADHSYTPGVKDSLSRWDVSESGTTITLTTLTGGQPNLLIIGPDDLGKFDHTGQYTSANASIGQHNPVVLGTATFTITIPGVTADSQISNLIFGFGTDATGNFVNVSEVSSPAVPIPPTVWLFGSGLLGLLSLRRMSASQKE